METMGNASEASVDCPKPLCEFLSSPWRLGTPEDRSFSSDKRLSSSRTRNSKLLRRRYRRPSSTLHPTSRLLCGAGRLCESPLPISQVLQTIKEVWVEPRSSSLGRTSMAPACGRHQLGLPRRRYSVPETVMRRYVLARADSRPDSVGGASEPPPSESVPSSSNSPVTSSVSLGSAYAPSTSDSKSSSDPVEQERSDRADKSCQYNELETADNGKAGIYIVGAYGAKTYPDVKQSSTDSNGDSRKILRLESLVSAGSTYRKKEEAKLTVPRYSALPRSISMLVNTSSVDNSSDGDSDTDGLSLVDSLEDRCVSAKRPVAREVAKAFFVPIEKGGESRESRESDTPEQNQKTLALSMPDKIKENITRRQRQIEMKRQQRRSSPSDKETLPLKTGTARRKLAMPRRKIVPHSCVGKSRTLPAMSGRKVVTGAKKNVPEEPQKTAVNLTQKAPSKTTTVQTEIKGEFHDGKCESINTNSNADENKIKGDVVLTPSKDLEVKCSNSMPNDQPKENCEHRTSEASEQTKSKIEAPKRVSDTVKSENTGHKTNVNKKRVEKSEVRSAKIEGNVHNEIPKNSSLLKGKRCSCDKPLSEVNISSTSPNDSPSDDSGKTYENCQQKLTLPKAHAANALKPLEAPKNPPFVPAIPDNICSNLPVDQSVEAFSLQRSFFKSAIPIKKSTSLNYRKFNVDISLSQQSSKPSPLSLRRPVRRFQPSPPLSRLSNVNRYHQRFDVIPEEKSGSLDSSNEDATRLAIDKTKKSAFSYNSQQISAVNKCNKLGSNDLHKGKASLSNDPDLLTLSKGWINFYLLKESQIEESGNEEGTAEKVKVPPELEWAPDKNTLKAPQLKRQPLAPVERLPSSGELACSESSSIYSTSDTDTSILPLRWQGSKVQHRTHVKRKQQGFQAAASSAGWSVTVASSLQHSPELEMRLSFPVCAHKTPASQSDSGLGEDTNNNNHSSSNSGHFLPLAQPQQRWTLTLRNQPQGTEKTQEGQKNGKRPFQCLPDLSFHPGQNKNSKKAIKAANIVLPTVTKTTRGSRGASAQSIHSIIWPNLNKIINHNDISRKLSASVPNLLSIQGSAITPIKKPGVLTMSERDTTRVHTARN